MHSAIATRFHVPDVCDRHPQVMYFSQTTYLGPVPSAESLQVLNAYFAWRRTPEGEAWAKETCRNEKRV